MVQESLPTQPSMGTADHDAGRDRKIVWASLTVGAIGVIVAIVALIVGLSANNSTKSNAKVARRINASEVRQINSVRADLHKNVAAATVLLTKLQRSSSQAHRDDNALRHDAKAAQAGVLDNRAQITAAQSNINNLQNAVGQLNAKTTDLNGSVSSLAGEQRTLKRRLNVLQRTVNALP